MQKRFFNLFCIIFCKNGVRNGKRGDQVRALTLEDRRKIELMWRRKASPVKIAAELEISQCTVYTELKRGQETDDGGGVVLDENFRPAYSAEQGQTVYQMNLRNRGRRPKKGH
jgi:IS30 family transposase